MPFTITRIRDEFKADVTVQYVPKQSFGKTAIIDNPRRKPDINL